MNLKEEVLQILRDAEEVMRALRDARDNARQALERYAGRAER